MQGNPEQEQVICSVQVAATAADRDQAQAAVRTARQQSADLQQQLQVAEAEAQDAAASREGLKQVRQLMQQHSGCARIGQSAAQNDAPVYLALPTSALSGTCTWHSSTVRQEPMLGSSIDANGPCRRQEVARLSAQLRDSAATLKASKQQAKAAAASLAGLQPELSAARLAAAQHKENRRLTIERRSQVGCFAVVETYGADLISMRTAVHTGVRVRRLCWPLDLLNAVRA